MRFGRPETRRQSTQVLSLSRVNLPIGHFLQGPREHAVELFIFILVVVCFVGWISRRQASSGEGERRQGMNRDGGRWQYRDSRSVGTSRRPTVPEVEVWVSHGRRSPGGGGAPAGGGGDDGNPGGYPDYLICSDHAHDGSHGHHGSNVDHGGYADHGDCGDHASHY